MAASDIKDRKSLSSWLRSRSSREVGVIAARAAMRGVAALEPASRRVGDTKWAPHLTLAAFRAYSATWSLVRCSERSTELLDAASHAHSIAKFAVEDHVLMADAARKNGDAHGAAAVATARAAAHAASIAAGAALHYQPVIHSAIEAIEAAAQAVGPVLYEPRFFRGQVSFDTILSSVRADAAQLQAGVPSTTVASAPLWPSGALAGAEETWNSVWRSMKGELSARPDEHWDVWIDWYDARLRGEPGNEKQDISGLLQGVDETWSAEPAVVNKKIKDIIARLRYVPKAQATITANAAVPIAVTENAAKAPVFISHASQADGARASALVRDLEAASVPCWLAPRDIPSGADWNNAIMKAIDACDAMILLVSDAALRSPFVKAEVQHAFETNKRVFPIRISDSSDAGQIDLRLKIVQHIDGRGETQSVIASILKSLD